MKGIRESQAALLAAAITLFSSFFPFPERTKLALGIAGGGTIPICLIWLSYLYYFKPQAKKPSQTFPHSNFRKTEYQNILWTWDYDNAGNIINLVPRCSSDSSPVSIYATGRRLHPENGQPFRGYTVVCPSCPNKIVASEPLSSYTALDRHLHPQPPLEEQARAYIEGKIFRCDYSFSDSPEKPPLTLEFIQPAQIDPQLYARVFKLRVTNTTLKTIYAVSVKLDALESNAWSEKKPHSIASLKTPYPLPLSPSKYKDVSDATFLCDINPGCSTDFDLLYVRLDMGIKWVIGLPPFHATPVKGTSVRTALEFENGTVFKENDPIVLGTHVSARDIPKIDANGILDFTFGVNNDNSAFIIPV